MMDTENTNTQPQGHPPQETPVCLRCMRPLDPMTYYCPYCGEAAGQLTPYIPFVNIAWKTHIWGNMWRQLWSPETSLPGRFLRLVLIAFYAPILLIGLLFRPWRQAEPTELSDTGGDKEDRTGEPAE